MGHTDTCLDVRLQQRLSEFPVLIPHGLQGTFVEVRDAQLKVFQPPRNVIQVSDNICPVLIHPHSTEIPSRVEVRILQKLSNRRESHSDQTTSK